MRKQTGVTLNKTLLLYLKKGEPDIYIDI